MDSSDINEINILFTPKEMDHNYLPSNQDVMCFFLFIQDSEIEGKKFTLRSIAKSVAKSIVSLWEKTMIPIVTEDRIIQLILKYHSEYRNLLKPYAQRVKDEALKENFDFLKNVPLSC